MDEEKFRRVHRILSRFFAVIIVDTGNNEKASNWLAALNVADALVVPAKWRHDSILGANRMLESLAAQHHQLLTRTLIVGTNGPGDSQAEPRARALEWFGKSHAVVEVPTDPHLHAGTVIDRRNLSPRTRKVGLQAAAAACGLAAEVAAQPPRQAPSAFSTVRTGGPLRPIAGNSSTQSGVTQ